MPVFINCSVPNIKYIRGDTIHNNPINIDRCTQFLKSKYAWYPDNKGLPTIEFKMEGDCEVIRWCFNNENERDKEYNNLLLKFNGK